MLFCFYYKMFSLLSFETESENIQLKVEILQDEYLTAIYERNCFKYIFLKKCTLFFIFQIIKMNYYIDNCSNFKF